MREAVRDKARRYLTSARIRVLSASAASVRAEVRLGSWRGLRDRIRRRALALLMPARRDDDALLSHPQRHADLGRGPDMTRDRAREAHGGFFDLLPTVDDQEEPMEPVEVLTDGEMAFVVAGTECFDQHHRLEHGVTPDRICCVDCQHVAAQAIRDGVDPAVVVELLRSGRWTREKPT